MNDYSEIVLPLRPRLFAAAVKLTGCEAAADDLVQDTLVRAFRFWHTFEPGTNALAWSRRIMRNAFINEWHKLRRREEIHSLAAAEMDAASINPTGCSFIPSPGEVVDGGRTREQVHEALECLPPDFQHAVMLADIEGLTYREIAEAMDCPMGTVMSRIHRGRRTLRGMLEDHAAEVGVGVAA